MIPVYKIEANDKDITEKIKQFLNSFRLTDGKGYESDSFEMTVSAVDGMEWPDQEIKLDVWIGFDGQELSYKGQFVTDEVEFSGPPDHFVIKARAADMVGELKAQRSVSWHGQSLGSIVEAIAKRNKLKPAISQRFYNISLEHIDQTNEADMHFITRLAQRYDAAAKVAGGSLVFIENGKGKTASGNEMPTFELQISDCNDYRFTRAGKAEFDGVAATFHDVENAKEDKALAGSEGKVKTLKRKYPTKDEAKDAADAEYKRLSRDMDTAEIGVQRGRPEFAAECKFTLTGFRTAVDTVWISKEVTHDFSKSGGLVTRLQLEKFQSD